MMKWMLAAGAAAMAIASPIAAERGGKGGEQRNAAQQQKSDRGGGQKVQSKRGGDDRQVKAPRGGRSEVQVARTDRGGERSRPTRVVQDENRGKGRDKVEVTSRDDDRGRGRRDDSQIVRVNKDGQPDRGKGNGRFADADADRIIKVRDFERGNLRVRDLDRDDLFVRKLGWGVGGCPPGLDKKDNGCMPPGQAAKLVGQPLIAATRLGTLGSIPLSMRSLFLDDDDYYYRWGGGYMYRVDRDNDLISSMIPLFGAALLGQPLQPSYMNNYYRPSYFNAFYPNSPYDCYQYGYGYVYETDCASGLVENVIPTYDYGYGVGQLMPASYGYYNVPFAYRSYFADDDDYYYRYAPGSIYRVDRETSLISAVVALLTNGLSVGQPLPAGYSAYNVPLAYRSSYYDSPDVWYRYDNGYIYAVDPGTRVVRNVAYVVA